jgi:hypothetical protein
VLAARKLGLDQIPVVVLDYLSETQKRAFIIAGNRISDNAGWNDEVLRGELAELNDAELDLALLGFSDDDLAALLVEAASEAEATGQEEAPEEIPEAPVEPVTRLGDVWLIGPHRLICGDCRDFGVIQRLLGCWVSGSLTDSLSSIGYSQRRSEGCTSALWSPA